MRYKANRNRTLADAPHYNNRKNSVYCEHYLYVVFVSMFRVVQFLMHPT